MNTTMLKIKIESQLASVREISKALEAQIATLKIVDEELLVLAQADIDTAALNRDALEQLDSALGDIEDKASSVGSDVGDAISSLENTDYDSIGYIEDGSIYELMEENDGICLECGEIHYGDCEPDMRFRECEYCGAHAVFGMEEAAIMCVR